MHVTVQNHVHGQKLIVIDCDYKGILQKFCKSGQPWHMIGYRIILKYDWLSAQWQVRPWFKTTIWWVFLNVPLFSLNIGPNVGNQIFLVVSRFG